MPISHTHKLCPSPAGAKGRRLRKQAFCHLAGQGWCVRKTRWGAGLRVSHWKEVDGERGHSGQVLLDDWLQKWSSLLLSFCRTAFKSHHTALGLDTADQFASPVLSSWAPSPLPGPWCPHKQREVSPSLPAPDESEWVVTRFVPASQVRQESVVSSGHPEARW